MSGLVPEGSSLAEALQFVAMHDPEPVTYKLVRENAAFDTKTLDRLRTKTALERVDRTEVMTPVVARTRPGGDGPYEYRMTEVGWREIERMCGTRNV